MTASPKYLKTIFGLAAVQVVLGILCFVIQVIAIVDDNKHGSSFIMNTVTPGVWGGVLFVLTGTLGCFFSKMKNSGLLVAYIVLSILSALSCLSIMGGAVYAVREFENPANSYGEWQFGLYVCLLFFSVVELITAVMASAFGCISHSVSRATSARVMGRMAYQTVYPNQVILVPSDNPNSVLLDGQQMVYMPTTTPVTSGSAAVLQCSSQTADLLATREGDASASTAEERLVPKPPPYTVGEAC